MWRRVGLAGRLFAAQALVVLIGSITASIVAAAVGPAIFAAHLHHAGVITAEASQHVEQAYTSASAVSLGVALLCALVAGFAISAFVAGRVAQPIGHLAYVAGEVSDGRYDVRAPAPGIGVEFDTVAEAFNAMAGRLQQIETTRRRLLGDVGHEMRTPLATIEAYLDAAEDGIGVDDEDTLAVLRAQTGRLRRLAEDLAAVSHAEEHLDLQRRPVSPAVIVDTAVAAAAPRYAAATVTLTAQVDAGLPDVEVDPQRLGQVLGNLLDNALRHTPPGGTVTVTADDAAGHVRIRVADTGEGIADAHLPHVFERFYRADTTTHDRAHGGSGIGLAIVRAIVTAHHGRVHASSDGPGSGATFTVTLPPAV